MLEVPEESVLAPEVDIAGEEGAVAPNVPTVQEEHIAGENNDEVEEVDATESDQVKPLGEAVIVDEPEPAADDASTTPPTEPPASAEVPDSGAAPMDDADVNEDAGAEGDGADDERAASVPADEVPVPAASHTAAIDPAAADAAMPLALPPNVDIQALLKSFNDSRSAADQTTETAREPAAHRAAQGATPQAAPMAAPWQVDVEPTKIEAPTMGANGMPKKEADALYEKFVEAEKRIMSVKAPSDFPAGTRLFVGNLDGRRDATNARGGGEDAIVSKRDLFFAFHTFGELAQISIKSSYAFVQFQRAADCRKAMDNRQGYQLKGHALNLEVSKPPGGSRAAASTPTEPRRRSRSPNRRGGREGRRSDGQMDYGHAGGPGRMMGQAQPVARDYYRASRSPPGRHGRGASPSRQPPANVRPYGDSHARRERTPVDDRPPMPPTRRGYQVPDVQIVVLDADQADRAYVDWVQSVFAGTPRSAYQQNGPRLTSETFGLSPRTPPLGALARHWIAEGVAALVFCERRLQYAGNKIDIQVFNRPPGGGGGSNVGFDEYRELDPPVAAQLVASRIAGPAGPPAPPPVPTGYGSSSYGQLQQSYGTPAPPQQQQQQQQAAYPPALPAGLAGLAGMAQDPNGANGLAAAIARMDPVQLQQVVTALNAQQQQQQQQQQHHQQARPPQAPHMAGDAASQVDAVMRALGARR